MGQGQSQASASGGRTLADERPAETQTMQSESGIPPEEQSRLDRERRAAAAQQRFDDMQKKKQQRTPAAGASGPPKTKTALEQLSAENRGWRAADEQADLRAWN
ncbi:hypothetical protein DM02DRAFT_619274 [Periconia macrospinosa]|uniref:Uncharacterized protein n=1 Tax=Periconia macrospinosa TaxID=97972 RepID=A0A2V1D867_9PLEO|nr:hypothetical protein DM02DRAFT_619274 [Periconia macrospinosa]